MREKMIGSNNHLCPVCHEPLIYIKFSHHYCLICNSVKDGKPCRKFHEPQGDIPRDDDKPQEKPKEPSERVLRADYQKYLARQNKAYHFARDLGIPSVIARDLRHRNRKYIEKVAKELVGV